jgi:hypothetical protein
VGTTGGIGGTGRFISEVGITVGVGGQGGSYGTRAAGTAGTISTGNGGSGAVGSSSGSALNGGNGGSGTVRLRYLGDPKHSTTAQYTVSNDATYTYIQFTASTSWTA